MQQSPATASAVGVTLIVESSGLELRDVVTAADPDAVRDGTLCVLGQGFDEATYSRTLVPVDSPAASRAAERRFTTRVRGGLGGWVSELSPHQSGSPAVKALGGRVAAEGDARWYPHITRER